jgi:hypothetical protein
LRGNQKPKKSLDRDSGKLARRPGRPAEFSNAQLRNRRDQLAQFFDAAWADVGWELPHCGKPNELIDIFNSLPQQQEGDIFSVFRRPSKETPDASELRKLKSIRRSLTKPSYLAEESKRHTHARLQRADWALTGGSKGQRGVVKRARKTQRKEASRAEQEHRDLTEKLRSIEDRIRALEASVAREEVFRFVKSGRYELKPMSLANAVANVPYSGWRQSMRRCKPLPSYLENGQTFRVFKAIRYLLAKASKTTETALVNDIRAGIVLIPSRYAFEKKRLARDWFYVERAIRRAYSANPVLGALPFRIVSQYLRQLRSRTQAEVGLAEQIEIKLPERKASLGTRPSQK